MELPHPKGGKGLIPVFIPSDHQQLMMVKLLLDNAGLRYHVENEHHYGVAGGRFSSGDTLLRVLVDPADAAEATRLIRELL